MKFDWNALITRRSYVQILAPLPDSGRVFRNGNAAFFVARVNGGTMAVAPFSLDCANKERHQYGEAVNPTGLEGLRLKGLYLLFIQLSH